MRPPAKHTDEDEARLVEEQRREAKNREAIEAREIRKYVKNNPLREKTFVSDIEKYNSIYVFCFSYAKLESPEYQSFLKSVADDNFGKFCFGLNRSLSRIIGTVPKEELKPDASKYITAELKPGLHKIGGMLDLDGLAVLLTDKPEDEVLSKLGEYRELDFAKPGQTPMETVVFQEGEVLALPAGSSAMKLCPKLKELGMPVELSGGVITLTKRFIVCEDGVRVTENCAKILKLLGIKMIRYFLKPMGYWSASTGETIDFPWE